MVSLSRRRCSVVIPVRDESPEAALEILTILTTEKWHDRREWETIIVDDGSQTPFPGARIRHEVSQGYGAAIKAGLSVATGEWVITADGDGQHRFRDLLRLVEFMEEFPENAMVVGDRRLKERGLRLWGRKGLNWAASLFAGRWIPDLNSGLRIFRRQVALGYLPILCDQFSFTTTLTLSMLADGYRVDWLPIRVQPRREGQSKVAVWRDGVRTLGLIVWIGLALRTRGLRAWLRRLRFT